MSNHESRPGESGIRESSSAKQSLPTAWQPLTFRGVASFSSARLGRLLLVQLIVALIVAAAGVWFLQRSWFPRSLEAIQALPATGSIVNRVLTTPRFSADPLAADGFIAFSVNLDGAASLGSASDVRVEFHRGDFSVCSLFGCLSFNYPGNYVVQFNQPELEAWWGAWKLTVIAGVGVVTVGFLFASWLILASCHALPVWLGAYFNDRQVSLAGSWKLASAALLAPAITVAISIVLYGLNAIDLLRLLLLGAAHIPLGWVYLYFATRQLPSVGDATARSPNPFTGPLAKVSERNPFSDTDSSSKDKGTIHR